jgi:hypothetical protein
MDDSDAIDGLPDIGALPLKELMLSDAWPLANAARIVTQRLEQETYAAHGSSPGPTDQPPNQVGGGSMSHSARFPRRMSNTSG